MHTRDVALPTAMNVAAAPTITATDAPKNAGWGITPIWNPMIVLAIFYAVLFLIFVAAVAFIFVRRRRRARAHARADPAHLTTTTTTTTTTYAGQDPEKGGEARGSVSGESDVGSEDPNKTVTIAHAGAGDCKGSPASDGTTGTGTGAGSKRYYTCDGPSEVWATPPPLPRSVRFSSRTWTQLSLPSHANLSDLSVAQRETSQVLVWLPSFNIQRNAGGDASAGAARVGEGEQSLDKVPGKAQEQMPEQLKRDQEREREGLTQREEVSAKEVCRWSCTWCDAFLDLLTCEFRTRTPSMAWHSSKVDFSLVLLGHGLGVL